MARSPLILVILSPEQIAKAKEINGRRKRITHALLCGPHGQIFGTEKQCLKYWSAWNPENRTPIFPKLFDKAVNTSRYEISDFESTFDLVNKLIAAEEKAKTPEPRLGNLNVDKSGCSIFIVTALFVTVLILVR